MCKIYKLISHQALYILYICDVLISSDCRIEYHSVMQLMSFIICFISCAKCLACLVTLRRAGLRSQGPILSERNGNEYIYCIHLLTCEIHDDRRSATVESRDLLVDGPTVELLRSTVGRSTIRRYRLTCPLPLGRQVFLTTPEW